MLIKSQFNYETRSMDTKIRSQVQIKYHENEKSFIKAKVEHVFKGVKGNTKGYENRWKN